MVEIMSTQNQIVVVCGCGKSLRAGLDKVGQTFSCPSCGAAVTVPPPVAPAAADQVVEQVVQVDGMPVAPVKQRRVRKPMDLRGNLPLILSSAALGLSCLLAFCMFFNNPVGKGLGGYSFKTPRKALMSELKIGYRPDLRVQMERFQLTERGDLAKEKLKTIEVVKEARDDDKTFLFIKFDRKGLTQYDVEAFEKFRDTKYYFSVSRTTNDDKLQTAITKWRKKSDSAEEDED